MNDSQRKDLIAQWAFDTRPVLSRFHLWLEDVEVDRAQPDAVSDGTFVPRGIARCLTMASAVTALGTRLFGQYGAGAGTDSATYNQVKKAADAVSAYVMSEGLWHLSRGIPENHAIMVCLGEGLMPKGGETPEMGANPLLGFGRVYARPEVATFVDAQVHRLLNEPNRTWEAFYSAIRGRGITIWGAAVDTLENTSRFAGGAETGPMAVFHLYDQPLIVTKPYEAYMGSLTVPRQVRETAEAKSVLLNFFTPRALVVAAVEDTYPEISRQNIHVWTLRGKSRAKRIGKLWEEWDKLGVHLIEDGWILPTGLAAFTDSGTYAPTWLVRSWKDDQGATHVLLCDGYAASAEAMQAASLSDALDVDVSMALYSPRFELAYDRESAIMKLDATAPDFAQNLAAAFDTPTVTDEQIAYYREAILDAVACNIPVEKSVLYADDLFPEKRWRVLASVGYMCPDPYSGAPGVEELGDGRYKVTALLATHNASSRVTLTFRLLQSLEETNLAFSPLLVRLISAEDFEERPVKVSDSGRVRSELQTMMSQALEYEGDTIRVDFDKLDAKVMPLERQRAFRKVLDWYKEHHPTWFHWLEIL